MRLEDFKKVVVDEFMGLYSRGTDESVPKNYSKDCQNVVFDPKEVRSRGGLRAPFNVTSAAVKRIFLATQDDTTLTLLTGDGLGNIYKDATGVLIIIGGTDFVALNLFNKTFLSACDAGVGVGNLKIWRGPGFSVRDAAGLAPVSAAMGAATGSAGSVDAGIHKIAVSYETDTGFITPPGPKVAGVFTPTTYNAPGGFKINLTGIPIGPAGTAKRRILATKADELEFFFVPGGTINDNVATTLTIDFFDSDLAISADYLFDLLEVIPGACGLAKYHGRLLVWGKEGDTIRVSRSGDPESISNVDGFISLPAERDGNTVKSSCQLRDILYFFKFPGIYAIEDNGGVPSSWGPVITIDGGAGSFFYGISTITASQPALSANDVIFLADRDGLYFFDGVVRRPELTYVIQDVWNRITHGKEFNITVAHDPYNRRVYVLLPVDGSATPNFFLMGDYSDGLSYEKIKWTPWIFPFTPLTIAMSVISDGVEFEYRLRLGEGTGKIYGHDSTKLDDNGTAINAFYESFKAFIQEGWVHFFTALRFRSKGVGNLILTINGQDGTPTASPPVLSISGTGKDLTRWTNLTGEKMSVKFGTNSLTHKFTVNRLDIYGTPRWSARPG